MTQRPIEEIVEEFMKLTKVCRHKGLHSDNTCDGTIHVTSQSVLNLEDAIRITLETERRQADERLREVVGEILKQKVTYSKREFRTITGGINDSPAEVEVIYCVINCEDIKTIAAKHNIDITPNTPQV